MRSRVILSVLATATVLAAAEPPSPPAKPPDLPSSDELYEAGKSLFDEYAPPEVKAQYEFPSRERWNDFAVRLQRALDNNDLAALAAYENEARAALTALRVLPGYEDYADWLGVRLDYIEAAKEAVRRPGLRPPVGRPVPAAVNIPYYDLWLTRIRARPRPARADELIPILRAAFVAEGVPPELAWLAEAESTLDPAARSPAGAKGLFQLMPDTAHALGLSTFLPDERADPEKSARAAAHYLRTLREKFGDWPLAFAAYNAGEGRVRRLLAARNAHSFAEVADALSTETRMYVPKVCATIAVRAGVAPGDIPAPGA
jgi:membrane-bound lytic murein transglycosylase D